MPNGSVQHVLLSAKLAIINDIKLIVGIEVVNQLHCSVKEAVRQTDILHVKLSQILVTLFAMNTAYPLSNVNLVIHTHTFLGILQSYKFC